ncbi:MAG: nucleolar DEAD-box protein required for synthesis of 60S ribosomal subunit [Candelaria pacifica]|nr:MAG: nucleolar DEAD-box protein required for synthesis of 60S ribosomal subunit [Candelaria pacifica]
MAPILKSSSDNEDPDFVLTLSDDDRSTLLYEQNEVLALPVGAKNSGSGSKRKREAELSSSSPNSLGRPEENPTVKKKRVQEENDTSVDNDGHPWTATGEDDGAMDSDFEFRVGDVDTGVTEDFDGWGLDSVSKAKGERRNQNGVDIDHIIARRRLKDTRSTEEDRISDEVLSVADDDEDVGIGFEEDQDGSSGLGGEEDEFLALDGFGMGTRDSGSGDGSDGSSDDESVASPVAHPDDVRAEQPSEDDKDDPIETARREAFFAPEEQVDSSKQAKKLVSTSFQKMSLSRPILRGLASVGFAEPTPIQTKTVPVALLGKDVVGGAVTGSGKTAAFIIPILERLLYRPKKIPTSRVAILMPTRELAVQCFNVAKKLASFTDITFCQLVGGFSLREQENVLRTRPDVIIATPGRFIDHMRNSASFTVDTLEILVLDEADRMLDDGFADELNEILATIPKSRQTMLFSATMTSSVDKLIRVGMNRPVRLLVDASKQTVGTLVQEFVRLRPGREEKRLGYLMLLCETVYTNRVIIFFRQKREAHRVRIVFGLCGFKAAELHGSMSQEQRIKSVEAFRDGQVSFLLATDLASRGLDIKGVETVINYEAPQSHEIYLHRVGRTARAGRTGRACTIAAEPDRKVVKAAVKSGRAQGAKIVSRAVEPSDADRWAKKIDDMKDEIEDVMKEEKEEKQLSQAEMQVRKGENIITHEDEIMARPKRTWFESEKEKRAAKKTGRAELNGVESIKGKKMKLSGKDKKRLDDKRERMDGKVWKKGQAERDGKGALDKPRGKKKKEKKTSGISKGKSGRGKR